MSTITIANSCNPEQNVTLIIPTLNHFDLAKLIKSVLGDRGTHFVEFFKNPMRTESSDESESSESSEEEERPKEFIPSKEFTNWLRSSEDSSEEEGLLHSRLIELIRKNLRDEVNRPGCFGSVMKDFLKDLDTATDSMVINIVDDETSVYSLYKRHLAIVPSPTEYYRCTSLIVKTIRDAFRVVYGLESFQYEHILAIDAEHEKKNTSPYEYTFETVQLPFRREPEPVTCNFLSVGLPVSDVAISKKTCPTTCSFGLVCKQKLFVKGQGLVPCPHPYHKYGRCKYHMAKWRKTGNNCWLGHP